MTSVFATASRALILILFAGILSACGQTTSPYVVGGSGFGGFPAFGQTPGFQFGQIQGPGATQPKVAVILPLSGQHAGIGQNMNQAARMAIEETAQSGVVFQVIDSRSTPQGAASAASAALNSGASLILGPLLGPSLTEVARVANPRGVAALGFTNDVSRASPGAFVMGLTPEQSVARMMQYAGRNGLRRVAVLAPANNFGHAASQAAQSWARLNGVTITVVDSYSDGEDLGAIDDRNAAAQRVANQRGNFDAVLIPDSGNRLREVASLLFFFEVEPQEKKFLGIAGWDDDALVTEQSLIGGTFAVPALSEFERFSNRYQSRFGVAPQVQSAAVYDSVRMAAQVAQEAMASGGFRGTPFTQPTLTRARGFDGVLGGYRLTTSGRVERIFEVRQITNSGIVLLERAGSFSGSGLPAG